VLCTQLTGSRRTEFTTHRGAKPHPPTKNKSWAVDWLGERGRLPLASCFCVPGYPGLVVISWCCLLLRSMFYGLWLLVESQ
jgi:hypothetical protein